MSDPQLRQLSTQPAETEPVRRGRNIIAVIGIDHYEQIQHLHNAVNDAQGVRKLFIEYLGFQELTPPLYNEQATRDAINALVIDQLSASLEPDDSLVLFFAGHGHTDTRQVGARTVKIGYLIPVGGSKPEMRKFSSYLKLDVFLEDVANLPARHILVILDACYSGFALGDTVEILRSPQRYSEDLSKRMSRRVITSAMADQPALDNGPVPGHSLFTGTLVEALERGKADEEVKGFVTSSELALYVQKQVAAWPDSKQTPDFGAFALDDRGELVISLVGETQNRQLAQEALQIAQHVYELGRFTQEEKRFTFAVKYYREALRQAVLGKIELPTAQLGLGKALFATGQFDEAIKGLAELMQRPQEPSITEAGIYLGMAQAQRQDYTAAAETLAQWQTHNPQHEDAGWIGEYVQWLQRAAEQRVGRRRALLIGINHYQLPKAFALPGCLNDVERLMKPLLIQRLGFQPEDIQLLTEEQATHQGVLAAFAALQQVSQPEDIVFVHYSGHSVPSSTPLYFGQAAQDLYWILYDTGEEAEHLVNGLTVAELHQAMKEIPALHKTLILDTHGNQALIDLAETAGDYNLILASDTAEIAYEWRIQQDGEDLHCGMLSGALYQSLSQAPNVGTFTYGDWVNEAVRITHKASNDTKLTKHQTPLLVGERDLSVAGQVDPYLAAFQFAQRKNWPELSLDQLARLEKHWQMLIQAPFPGIAVALGRAFSQKGAYSQAVAAFARAIALGRKQSQLALAFAEVRDGNFSAARDHLQHYVAEGEAIDTTHWAPVLEYLEKLTGIQRQVVIFLRDLTFKDSSATPRELTNKVDQQIGMLKGLLQQKYGEHGLEFETIPWDEADNQQVLHKLQNLVEQPGDPPAVVCIIGGPEMSAIELSAKSLFEAASKIIAGKSIFLWVQKRSMMEFTSRKSVP